MVLVKHDAVVVLSTSITATTWVLAVLANTTMASTDVTTLLAVLPQSCRNNSKPSFAVRLAKAAASCTGPTVTHDTKRCIN